MKKQGGNEITKTFIESMDLSMIQGGFWRKRTKKEKINQGILWFPMDLVFFLLSQLLGNLHLKFCFFLKGFGIICGIAAQGL